MKRIIIVVVVILFSQSPLSAQTAHIGNLELPEDFVKNLTSSEQRDHNTDAINTVKSIQTYISHFSNPKMTFSDKKEAMELALGLFVNDNIMVYDTTSLMENIDQENGMQIREFFYLIMGKVISDINVEWNNIYSTEEFDPKTRVKIVNANQVIKYIDGHLVKEFSTSNKLIEAHLVLERKKIHDEISEIPRVKLGTISY